MPSAPVPAPAASSPQLEPSRNRGPSPEPGSESLPPLGSVTAPCPTQRKHRHRREGKRDNGCLFSHTPDESGERVCSVPPMLPLPFRHLGSPSRSCACRSSREQSVSQLLERCAAGQALPKMRSKAQDATRQEKNDRWLDSGGVTRKHKAGKGTVREGRGQAVPQRWRKKQQKLGEGAGQRPTKEDRSRMQMQKNTCNRQHDREEGKKE